MKAKVISLRRLLYGATALAVGAAVFLPALAGQASAALATSRYIKMSTSQISATSTSYEVGFTVATTGNIQGVVVDFCTSPILGTACTKPTGLDVGTPTVATSGGANTGLSGSWTPATDNSGRTFSMTNGSGGSVSASTNVVFTITSMTNPSTVNQTFYARIFTFATSGAVATWLGTADGSSATGVVDSGGLALSTAAQITVTAKVQETLTFCVYTGVNCAAGGTSVALGDTNGVLSTAGAFVDKNTKYDVATNAASGVTIRFKAGLPTSGANTIASIGTSATSSSAGTSQFGLCTYESSGSGLTAAAPYDNGNCSGTTQTAGTGSTGGTGTAQFAFDTSPAATTYGDDLATKTAGNSSTGIIAYVGNVSPTQPAGIYTNTFTFIATGTY